MYFLSRTTLIRTRITAPSYPPFSYSLIFLCCTEQRMPPTYTRTQNSRAASTYVSTATLKTRPITWSLPSRNAKKTLTEATLSTGHSGHTTFGYVTSSGENLFPASSHATTCTVFFFTLPSKQPPSKQTTRVADDAAPMYGTDSSFHHGSNCFSILNLHRARERKLFLRRRSDLETDVSRRYPRKKKNQSRKGETEGMKKDRNNKK